MATLAPPFSSVLPFLGVVANGAVFPSVKPNEFYLGFSRPARNGAPAKALVVKVVVQNMSLVFWDGNLVLGDVAVPDAEANHYYAVCYVLQFLDRHRRCWYADVDDGVHQPAQPATVSDQQASSPWPSAAPGPGRPTVRPRATPLPNVDTPLRFGEVTASSS